MGIFCVSEDKIFDTSLHMISLAVVSVLYVVRGECERHSFKYPSQFDGVGGTYWISQT